MMLMMTVAAVAVVLMMVTLFARQTKDKEEKNTHTMDLISTEKQNEKLIYENSRQKQRQQR